MKVLKQLNLFFPLIISGGCIVDDPPGLFITESSETTGFSSSSLSSSSSSSEVTVTSNPIPDVGSYCGNSKIEINEECDGDVNCNNECYRDRWVFITSIGFTGLMDGLNGADNYCNKLAEQAHIVHENKFRAWISSNDQSVTQRFSLGKGRYVLLNGELVIENGLDLLIDGPLVPIYINELFEKQENVYVWTNTHNDGIIVSEIDSCSNWKSESGGLDSFVGYNGSLDSWSYDTGLINPTPCDYENHLYCFEEE